MDEHVQTIAHKMGEKDRKLYCNVTFCLCLDYSSSSRTFRIGSKSGRLERGMRKHFLIISISIYPSYNYINKRSLFLLLPNEISLSPFIPSFSFITVLIDF